MSSHRQLRVRELLKREIGEAIRREVRIEEGGLINVNDVDISSDLRQATVILGFYGTNAQQRNALNLVNASRLRIQDWVAKAVIMKFTPRLRFVLDDSIERGNRVLRLMEDLEKETGPEASAPVPLPKEPPTAE